MEAKIPIPLSLLNRILTELLRFYTGKSPEDETLCQDIDAQIAMYERRAGVERG